MRDRRICPEEAVLSRLGCFLDKVGPAVFVYTYGKRGNTHSFWSTLSGASKPGCGEIKAPVKALGRGSWESGSCGG